MDVMKFMRRWGLVDHSLEVTESKGYGKPLECGLSFTQFLWLLFGESTLGR